MFGGLLLDFVGLLDVLPVLHVLDAVGVNLQRLFDVFFAHVNLAIVDEDAAAPKQELGHLDELALHLGCVGDRVGHVVGVLSHEHLQQKASVLAGISRRFENTLQIKACFVPVLFVHRLGGEFFVLEELADPVFVFASCFVTQSDRAIQGLGSLRQVAGLHVARVGAHVCLRELSVQRKSMFAVTQSLLEFLDLDVGNSTVSEHTLSSFDILTLEGY